MSRIGTLRLESAKSQRLLIILISLFYFVGIGKVHLFDWDEINFAECAREMIVTGEYLKVQIDFLPFWEKPPLFFWLQVLSMKVFGINEFASRFPNALFGTITLFTIYEIGLKEKGKLFGLIWALVYFGSLLPHLYFKSGIIDPVFNFFIFVSTYFVYKAVTSNERTLAFALLAGFFNALAVLTKGPVGFLLLFLTLLVIILFNRMNPFKFWKEILFFALSFLGILCLWMVVEVSHHGFEILEQFIDYQIALFKEPVAGHSQPFYYHFLVILIGCFPMSIFGIKSFFKKQKSKLEFDFWMKSLFWVVLILFSIVTTKIVHYSSMCYLPLSFLATDVLMNQEKIHLNLNKVVFSLYTMVGLALALAITLIPLIPFFSESITPMINDPFAVAAFNSPLHWSGIEIIAGIPFLISVVYGVLYFRKENHIKIIAINAFSMATTLLLVLFMVLPKIEQYTQGAAIDFYKEQKGKQVYIRPYGFKSYAHFFYCDIRDEGHEQRRDMNWLLEGDVDRPVFLVTKIQNEDLDNLPQFKKVKTNGGFKFYSRIPE